MKASEENRGVHEKIQHVKRFAVDSRNGQTCITPEIVWFMLPLGWEKRELIKKKLFGDEESKENTSDEVEVEFFFCTKCGKKFNTEYTFSAVFAAVHWRKTQFHQLFNGLFSHQKLFSKLSG